MHGILERQNSSALLHNKWQLKMSQSWLMSWEFGTRWKMMTRDVVRDVVDQVTFTLLIDLCEVMVITFLIYLPSSPLFTNKWCLLFCGRSRGWVGSTGVGTTGVGSTGACVPLLKPNSPAHSRRPPWMSRSVPFYQGVSCHCVWMRWSTTTHDFKLVKCTGLWTLWIKTSSTFTANFSFNFYVSSGK